MKLKLTTAMLLFCQWLLAQNQTIEGVVANRLTGETIPYANIYNKSLQKGTISNEDGYFRLEISGPKDSVLVSFLGYKSQYIALSASRRVYEVLLEESGLLLHEIVVTPKLSSYLYDRLSECRKQPSTVKRTAKAYYGLKTYRDDQQIELVESFYNLDLQGYDVAEMKLKAGRLALQPFGDRFFVSMESSLAIAMLRLLDDNDQYPTSPLSLSKKRLKKQFSLSLDRRYLDADGDSIYVIAFDPFKSDGRHYSGKIWVNTSKQQVLKLNLACEHCSRYPFKPLFSIDSIVDVGLDITKTFAKTPDGMAFNHVDFNYNITYKSVRKSKLPISVYSIKSNAILYAYDFEHQFGLPLLDYSPTTYRGRDYRSISAMPYNDFFWKNHDEYSLNDERNTNQRFFEDPKSTNNRVAFKQGAMRFKTGLFEHPFVHWSKARVRFREVMEDTTKTSNSTGFNSEKFNLAVKVFVDINTYKDSTNILTATIFDPYESYYYLPMDNKALCFINLFFDYCELERRKLEQGLKAAILQPDALKNISAEFATQFELRKREFIKSVERGTNEAAMLKWNEYVKAGLGIDNVALFRPFVEAEKD